MLDLSLKWGGKLTDAEVTVGMARGWERQSGLEDEFCGRRERKMGDGRPGTRLSAMLNGVFITQQDELCTSVADGEQYFKPCNCENNNDNKSNERI